MDFMTGPFLVVFWAHVNIVHHIVSYRKAGV